MILRGNRHWVVATVGLAALLWTGCMVAAVLVLGASELVRGCAIDITMGWYGQSFSLKSALPHLAVFCAVVAIAGVLWLLLCERKAAHRPWLGRIVLLTIALELGLAATGVVWAYFDMRAGYWPGWRCFIGNCESAALVGMLNSIWIAWTRPESLAAYYSVGLLLLERCSPLLQRYEGSRSVMFAAQDPQDAL